MCRQPHISPISFLLLKWCTIWNKKEKELHYYIQTNKGKSRGGLEARLITEISALIGHHNHMTICCLSSYRGEIGPHDYHSVHWAITNLFPQHLVGFSSRPTTQVHAEQVVSIQLQRVHHSLWNSAEYSNQWNWTSQWDIVPQSVWLLYHCSLPLFPGLPTIQFLITCSMPSLFAYCKQSKTGQ